MFDYDELDRARQRLELGETATLKEIKGAYRRLSHRYHPDKNNGDGNEAMKSLNQAYKLVLEYVDGYRVSFMEKDTVRADPYSEHLKRFYDGGF